ncbi:hypothetical protein [Cellulomonas endometrii]|uniref:hypothetical protein n=1 Tax=Cellulomonas endometrii TaxID=3036301 RepID=UPI0024ADFCA0|nr:hypothetical protein [Cellulomonas endometrii]
MTLLTLSMLLPILLIAGAWVFVSRQSITEPAPVMVIAEPNDAPMLTQAAIALEWATDARVVAPAWAGTFTSVDVAPGDTLTEGVVLARVDGISRIGVRLDSAFYRPLSTDATGTDVGQLNSMLARLGFEAPSGERFTRLTQVGVRQLAAHLGVPAPATTTAFDPSWVVRLPSDSSVVATVAAQAGQAATANDPDFIELRPDLRAGHVAPEVDDSDPDADPTDEDGTAASTLPTLAVDEGSTVVVAQQELLLAPDRSTIAPESLPVLASLAEPGARFVNAQLARPPAADEFVLPAAAVFSVPDGRTCVAAATGGDAIPVDVLASDSGRVIVRGPELTTGTTVVVDPATERRSCR